MPTSHNNQPRRTLLLTGASRGIGHATVKRFSAAGWRVIRVTDDDIHDPTFIVHAIRTALRAAARRA